MDIKMNQFGSSLCTRISGRKAYLIINEILDSTNEIVVFDFDGVDLITNSFADETFGRLAAERDINNLRLHTTFKNINRNTALLVRSVMEHRIAHAKGHIAHSECHIAQLK